MKILKKSKKKNYLVTVCIGKISLKNWKKFILPSWKKYCKKNDLGLIYFDKELISRKGESGSIKFAILLLIDILPLEASLSW